MRDISLKELLEAGCHFGHQVTRQNPRAREFIYTAREGIHIIDLAKTREGLLTAGQFVADSAGRGGSIMLVGTKRQARSIVADAVKKITQELGSQTGTFVVTERWVGGTLTNLEQVSKNYKKLKDLRVRLQSDEEKAKYTKKEVGMWEKERVKLEALYGGVCDMETLPDFLYIIDTHKEDLALREANLKGIPIVGIVDTNADPTLVDYAIPANDDAVGSIQLITDYLIDAWIEGNKERIRNQESFDSAQDKSGSMEGKKVEVRSDKLEAVGDTKDAGKRIRQKDRLEKKKTAKTVKKPKKP